MGEAEQLLGALGAMLGDELRGPDGVAPFGPSKEAPASASAADKLAAFLGRDV